MIVLIDLSHSLIIIIFYLYLKTNELKNFILIHFVYNIKLNSRYNVSSAAGTFCKIIKKEIKF